MTETTVGFIGAGNMAGAIIRGLVKPVGAGAADPGASADGGLATSNILAADLDRAKIERLAAECGIGMAAAPELIRQVDVAVLAVKPQSARELCRQLAAHIPEPPPLVLSIMAGIRSATLERWLGRPLPVVRCMPNLPAVVGMGASGLHANERVSVGQKQAAQRLLDAVGCSAWLRREDDLDSVTALSGSGPAYILLFMEAMRDTAMGMGLAEDTASLLACRTVAGAAALVTEGFQSADMATLRRNVTSPGGTTERALREFESGQLRQLVTKAMEAARARSQELAEEANRDD